MTAYLIETSTFSHMMRQSEKVAANIGSLSSNDLLMVCPIVRGEIMFGINDLPQGKRRTDLLAKANALFEALVSRDISDSTALYYADLKAKLKKAGRLLSDNDLWIAATALQSDAVLIAADDDYSPLADMAGLRIEDWTK